jgi:CheY-like chemotaxis protein
VLIVEDQPFIALDLALAVEDAGGEVVGPAASVQEALALIEGRVVSGAILDVHLTDRDISPLADVLLGRGIPIIVQTGVGIPPELAARFPDLVVRTKPCVSALLVTELAALIVYHQRITQITDGEAAS